MFSTWIQFPHPNQGTHNSFLAGPTIYFCLYPSLFFGAGVALGWRWRSLCLQHHQADLTGEWHPGSSVLLSEPNPSWFSSKLFSRLTTGQPVAAAICGVTPALGSSPEELGCLSRVSSVKGAPLPRQIQLPPGQWPLCARLPELGLYLFESPPLPRVFS